MVSQILDMKSLRPITLYGHKGSESVPEYGEFHME